MRSGLNKYNITVRSSNMKLCLSFWGVISVCAISSNSVLAGGNGNSDNDETVWNNTNFNYTTVDDAVDNNIFGRQSESDTSTSDNQSNVIFSISPFTRFVFSSDIAGNANDDYKVWRSGINTSLITPISDSFILNYNLNYEYSNYDFDAPNNFIAGANEPFGDIQILDVGVLARVQADEKWSWFAGVSARYAGESGVSVSDAGTIGAKAGLGYQINDSLSASFGAYVTSQIEDDALILPAISIDWAINEKWNLEFQGTKGLLSYKLNDNVSAGLGAGWENRRFRVNDNSLKNAAVIEDSAIPVFVTLDYKSADQVFVNVNAGVITGQEFQIEDRNGNNQRKYDSDTAGFVGMNVKIVF